jgi:hypothetical protein
LRWVFKSDARYVFLTPDCLADVNRAEIVEAEIERVRQFISFKSELDAKAETCKIMYQALVYAVILDQDLGGMEGSGAS